MITFTTHNVANTVMKNQEESVSPASDIPVLLKIGEHFILQGEIRSATRFGKGCRITLHRGDEYVVNVSYDRVVDFVK